MVKNSPATLASRNALRRKWKDEINPKDVPKFKLGICKECGKYKDRPWATTFTQTGQPEYRPRCHPCHLEFLKRQQSKFRKNISTSAKVRKSNRKKECINYLGGKCISCGYCKSPHALTFHHKRREEKYKDVSSMLDYSWAKLSFELDRCELLCFNCHMEIEEIYRG